jgi:hypothetical protein
MRSREDTFRERAAGRRAEHRAKLSSLYVPYYDALCEYLGRDSFWYPYQSLRTLMEQSVLFNQGRDPQSKARGEKIVTMAMPGDSAHNWGCATDWVEYRPEWKPDEIWVKSNWDKYAECIKKAGLVWGGSWKRFIDKPHNELRIGVTWKQVGDEYRKAPGSDIKLYIASKMKHPGKDKMIL